MTAEILWEIDPLLERATNVETDVRTYEGIPGMVYDYPGGMPAMDDFRDFFERIQRFTESYFRVVEQDIFNLAETIMQMRELDQNILGTAGGVMMAESLSMEKN